MREGDKAIEKIGLLERTISNLRFAWNEIAKARSSDGSVLSADVSFDPDLPDEQAARLRALMQDCLDGRGGEVSARVRAASLGRAYLSLSPKGRQRFLRILAEDFDIDRATVKLAIAALAKAPEKDDAGRRKAERALRAAFDAPRLKLLTQFNGLPEGVKFLVDLRAELLGWSKRDPALEALEGDIKGLLAGWFDVGFLELRRITWDSPAALLEKLMAYEAVHEIHGWADLKNRLDSDRRCFAFFHPRMPDEPLIFVEVALVDGLADNIQKLLDREAPVLDPQEADTAIFYSISNAQRGLVGIQFGGFLIKRVVDLLAAQHRNLKYFATLSPVPGFRAWLTQAMKTSGDELLLPAERKAMTALPLEIGDDARGLETLLRLPSWHKDAAVSAGLRSVLMRLCARYLVQEKREDGAALDPVAHFHLSNGARIERIDWLGDPSEKGLAQSCGLMVNYRYRQGDIESNHEAYTGAGKVVASTAVRALLKS